jgi:hypothetical protein
MHKIQRLLMTCRLASVLCCPLVLVLVLVTASADAASTNAKAPVSAV